MFDAWRSFSEVGVREDRGTVLVLVSGVFKRLFLLCTPAKRTWQWKMDHEEICMYNICILLNFSSWPSSLQEGMFE